MTVSMPTEMDEQIAEEAEKYGMSYSQYVRSILRQATETPFDEPDERHLVVDDSDAENAQKGAV